MLCCRPMSRLHFGVFSLLSLGAFGLASCGDDAPREGVTRPKLAIDALPVAKVVTTRVATGHLAGTVDLVRDKQGVVHVYAATERDAAFGNGWIAAHDRLIQMQVFRHIAAGRLSELFGALQRDVIEGDFTMRTHMLRAKAEASFAELAASTDPTDQGIVRMLQGYADGVNAYVEAQRRNEFKLDDSIDMWFDIEKWEPWTPVDTLALGRLQQFSLAYNDFELRLTRAREQSAALFDNAAAGTPEKARAGAFHDLYNVHPMDTVPTVDGWPNVGTDTGSRASGVTAPAWLARIKSPEVPLELLDALLASRGNNWLQRSLNHSVGSNNWVIAGSKTQSGRAVLANDTHLPLLSPSIWYSVHLVVPAQPDKGEPGLDVIGESFPGVPGVLLGMNQHVAWGATVAVHDVNDIYKEDIVPCAAGGGDCVKWKGTEVKLEKRTETFKIGAVGTITQTKMFEFEVVPHHGPILPVVQNYEIKARTPGAGTALSVRFTGHDITQEVRTVYGLNRAKSNADAFKALKSFEFGAFNWVIIDDQNTIGWSTAAKLPMRPLAAMTYDAKMRPDGTSPVFVLPGDGSADWDGWMDPRYIPHAINPAQGYLVSANSDPVGETFDGDALNGPLVDGKHLYISATYDVGFRTGRITRLIQQKTANGAKISFADQEKIQADAHSNSGERMRPFLAAAMVRLEAELATPGSSPDLTALATTLAGDAPRLARLREAAMRIKDWTLDTPAGVAAGVTDAEIKDSVATMLFNSWQTKAVRGAIGDELGKLGDGVDLQLADRAFLQLLERPTELLTLNASTGQSAMWDDLGTPAVTESRDFILVSALDQAVAFLAGPPQANGQPGFDSTDMSTWRWGKVHKLKLDSRVVPNDSLDLPAASETDPLNKGGFPRHGENHTVDVANNGLGLDFTYSDGAARRWVCEVAEGGGFKAKNALPGGQIFNPTDPHYRDQLDKYWLENESFDVPVKDTEVVTAAEARWQLTR